jgi:Cysteine rich repeat
MINTLRPVAFWTSLTAIVFAMTTSAHSQAPTDAQRSAIRAQCRADYQANCASVPPGGMASLQCLQKNMSSLSPGCQAAVRAVEAPAAPKAETAPATPKAESAPDAAPAKPAAETAASPKTATAPKPAASPAAKKPSSAQVAAIRSACRSDYQQNCAGVPTGGAAALSCLQKNKENLSASCQRAVSAVGGSGGAPSDSATADPAAMPAAAPAAALVLRPMRPREVIFVLRSGCGEDARALCSDVPPGGGRIMQCLAAQPASLSPACSSILSQFAGQ